MSIDYTNDYHNKEVAQEKIILLFKQTCNYVVSELGFKLTRVGHDWQQFKARRANSISFRLIQNQQLSKKDDEYIRAFNYEKSLLIEKLQEFAIYLHLNSDNVSKAFLGWLKLHDTYVDEPISNWNNNITSTVIFNNEQIHMKDLCSIALRILILPATEAICERCFSQLKVIHNHLRNSLKNDILDCLLRNKLNLLWSNNIDEIVSRIDDNGENSEEEDEDEENEERIL